MTKSQKIAVIIIAVLVFLIILSVFLLNSKTTVSYARHMEEVAQMKQTSTVENDANFAGFVSGIRTGVYRKTGSLGTNEYECTDNGVYFLASGLPAENDGSLTLCSYLFYADHGSDSMIKLCSRPDCTHDNLDCNAAFPESVGGITYYNGYLYITTFTPGEELMILYRMKPDGSDRIAVLDCSSVNNGQYNGYNPPFFMNGVWMVGLCSIDNSTGASLVDWYYCKLDGDGYELKKSSTGYCWNDGEAFLFGSLNSISDSPTWTLHQWDPDTNADTLLAAIPCIGDPSDYMVDYIAKGYWGKDNGLVHYNGQLLKVNYPDGDTEVVFDTGIMRDNRTRYYPDCIAIHEKANQVTGENGIIHVYCYDGTKVGQVEIDIPNDTGTAMIFSESRERIYLGCNSSCLLPTHYIDKSEFGSTNGEPNELVLHEIQYPDLDQDILDTLFSGESIYIE